MLDANVKEQIMAMEVLRALSRLYWNIEEIARREVGGKLIMW